MTPDEIVAKFNLTEDAADPRWAGSPKRVWRGSRGGHGVIYADPTGDWNTYDQALKADVWDRHNPTCPGWQYIEGWIDGPYRVVWVSFEHRATFTYCEGDLSLVVCGDEATFEAELAGGDKYYGERVPRSYTLHPDGTKTYDD